MVKEIKSENSLFGTEKLLSNDESKRKLEFSLKYPNEE